MKHLTMPSLADADLASRSPLATEARALALVPDADVLADRLFVEFRAAWAVGDENRMAEVIVDAIWLDAATPGGPRLMDEIRGINTPAAVA